MILNIGNDKYIYKKDIIAILNINIIKNNKDFQVFLDKIKNKGYFFGEQNGKIKSYIITNNNKKTHVYSSIISSKTLSQRNNIEIWR